MEQRGTLEQAAPAVITTLFRMCRDSRSDQQDVADVARQLQVEYAAAKKVIAWLELQGYVETLTFGQKVMLTDAGIVLAQRLIH